MMAAQHYFLLSSLPHLGELGSAPPVTSRRLLEMVTDAGGPQALIETLLLEDDLVQREAVMAGEIDQAEPVVLTVDQLRDEQPLPEALSGGADQPPGRIAADAVWGAYFHHAADVARQSGSGFLAARVAWEVALRNALAEARAKTLGLDATEYLVAEDLADRDADLAAVLNEWAAAGDPLAGLRAINGARWGWLVEHEGWFTFGDDELAAYAAKLMMLHRWHRLDQAQAQAQAQPQAPDQSPAAAPAGGGE